MSARRTSAVVALAVSGFSAASATTWNVNPAGTGDVPTIQDAFDSASPGDIVILAPGTYTDANTRTIADFGTNATTTAIAFMSAGVDIVGSGGADVTVLDGQSLHHCLVGTDIGAVNIRGITFRRGRNTGTGGQSSVAGSGVIIFRSGPIVEACVFDSCQAPSVGLDGAPGLYLVEGSSAVVRECLFFRNFSGTIGGAVGVLQHSGVTFRNNTFVHNFAGTHGGAVEVNRGTATFEANIFANNRALFQAGAIYCLNGASVSGSCNLFWNNYAQTDTVMTAACSFVGTDGNVVADPIFCLTTPTDFTIRSDSPAAPGVDGCTLRGAFPVACGAVSVESASWGRVKSRYRN